MPVSLAAIAPVFVAAILALAGCASATHIATTPAPSDCGLADDLTGGEVVARTDLRCNGADLSGHRLVDVEARRGSFRETDFSRATLKDVDMRGSDLRGADFADATLTRVDLSDANLTDADFERASVTDVDISRARRCRTVRANGTIDSASCPEHGNTSRDAHSDASRVPVPGNAPAGVAIDAFSVNGGRPVDCPGAGVARISAGWATSGPVQTVVIDADGATVASGLPPNGSTQVPFDCGLRVQSYDLTVVGPNSGPDGAAYATQTIAVRAT